MSATEICKIFTMEQWKNFEAEGLFKGSPHDTRDGFIHMSQMTQVEGVIARYFQGLRPLIVARFSTLEFGSDLVWEAASNGDIYPHIYGRPLNWKAVIGTQEIS